MQICVLPQLRRTDGRRTEGRMIQYYDTSRELLTEDMQSMTTILGALEGVGPELPERTVILAMARAIYHILAYAIRILEKERRKENGRS